MVDTNESWVQEPPTLELPTPDLTPDPTLDPTLDPTPEQTPEPTPEQTLKQTPEPTPEPIQEPTLIGPSGPLTQKRRIKKQFLKSRRVRSTEISAISILWKAEESSMSMIL